MRKYKNIVGGNCDSNVNVSNYTNPCGSLHSTAVIKKEVDFHLSHMNNVL